MPRISRLAAALFADRFIEFGDTTATGTGFRNAQLDFLEKTLGR